MGVEKKRTRNWELILYPDSSEFCSHPKIVDALQPIVAGGAVSPLHNCDKTEKGDLKKAHFHILIHFSQPKSFSQVKEIAGTIAAARWQPVHDINAAVRYLAHLNAPEKYQYDPNAICFFGDFQKKDVLENSTNLSKTDQIFELHKIIRENRICSYAQLCDFCEENRPDLKDIVVSKYAHIIAYQKSCVWESSQNKHDSSEEIVKKYALVRDFDNAELFRFDDFETCKKYADLNTKNGCPCVVVEDLPF